MTRSASSSVSRRKALTIAAGAAATGVLSIPFLGFAQSKLTSTKETSSWWTRETINLATGSITDWQGQVGTVFTLQSELGTIKASLKAVNALPSPGVRPSDVSRATAFSLVFAPVKAMLPAGDRIYLVSHSTGNLPIYFSDTDLKLIAIFN